MNQEVQALLDITRDVTTSFDTDLNESLLIEKTRQELINKSRNSDNYTSKGREGQNRYTRRLKSQIANSVRDYNRIDMDGFWKGDILDFDVRVHGETDDYVVSLTFSNILNRLEQEVKGNNNKLEFKCVLRALIGAFNSDTDLLVGCTCPDWKYRQAYWATQGKYNSVDPQTDNGKWIANPNDTKGGGCKHVNLVLSNLDWMMKIASVINNYVKWCKENMERNYADYIFPKIYGMPYNRAVQLSLFDDPDDNGYLLPDAKAIFNPETGRYSFDKSETEKELGDIIDKTAMKGRDAKGRWTSDNDYKFKSKPRERSTSQEDDNALNLKFGDEDAPDNKDKRLVIDDEEE